MTKIPGLILMAEDDEDYYLTVREAFEQYKIIPELRRVKDGEELLDYLLARGRFENQQNAPRPHLILLDLNLPKINGLEALREIKSHEAIRQIPVVILSVSRESDDIRKSYALGAASYLNKPFGLVQLVETFKVFRQYWFELVELPRRS